MVRTTAIVAAAIVTFGLSAPAWAGPPLSDATDFSSQQNNKKKKGGPAGGAAQQGGGGNVNRNVNRNVNVNRNINVNHNTNVNVNRNANIRSGAAAALPAAAFRTGPGRVNANFVRPANISTVRLSGRVAPAWRTGPRRIWWGGGWRTFVPLTALGVVALGGAYYYPDAYLAVARPYCSGITPDGCRLNWQQIEFEGGGGGEWQCVQFCRRPGAPPPPRTVALVEAPPLPPGGTCEISIYSEPGFAGTNAQANTEQPNLGETGWQNQIASVKVASGTWDFFSDPQFTGETMRLAPGEYGDLGSQWSKHSGSFMCVQP